MLIVALFNKDTSMTFAITYKNDDEFVSFALR